ncbi:MAG: NYN domain-containing protein [Thermomicrobiales bacterium]
MRSKREVRLVSPPAGVDPRQTAWVRQEKRSDVTLATHLLTDAFDGKMTVALLVTNDSDFVEPIRIVRDRFTVRVIVIRPDDRVSKRLAKEATFARPLDHSLLAQCQLPEVIVDRDGRDIFRPPAWSLPANS